MSRRLSVVLSCACLLLCGAAAALGVRGRLRGDVVSWEQSAFVPGRCGGDWEAYRWIALSSHLGTLAATVRWEAPPPRAARGGPPSPRDGVRLESYDADETAGGEGFSLDADPPPGMPWRASCPAWAAAVAFGLLPGWRGMGWNRRRKRAGGPAFEVVTREG